MNTSDFFSFLEQNKTEIVTYRIECDLVKVIRSYLRSIYLEISEVEDANLAAALLRLELLKLQSSPLIPPPELLTSCGLDDSERNKRVWGTTIANVCDQLGKAIRALDRNGSPLSAKMVDVVSVEIKTHGLEQIKIWCHRKEQESFIDLFHAKDIYLTDQNFICSLDDYRKSDIFRVLVRLGPLRTQGWSKTPSVILNAPRYHKLLRFVWSHSLDDEDFGVEPVMGTSNYLKISEQQEYKIVENIQIDGVQTGNTVEEVDDFKFLGERPQVRLQNSCSCVLVEFSGGKGVLLPPGSHQLIFDQKRDTDCLNYRHAQMIEPGNFLLMHNVEADLGRNGLTGKTSKFTSIWKQKLQESYCNNPSLLMERMRSSGINLQNLESATKRWIQSDGEVICAPQSREHFRIMIEKVLAGLSEQIPWQQAWREVQDSRVQAIQHGRIEHAIVNDQLVALLKRYINTIRENCSRGDFFRENIDPASGLSGAISFFPVHDVSTGFKAPQDRLEDIKPVVELELFRMDI